MEISKRVLSNGFAMPTYGLGTWLMGGARERDLQNDDAADRRSIRAAIEHGVTHLDTGESYAAGHTEVIIGEAIRGVDRESLFIASKFSGRNASAPQLTTSAENSLQRLGVDYLDLYMPNFFNSQVPLEETIGAMAALVDRGLVRYLGVSNFGMKNLDAAQNASPHPIVCNQVHYNAMVREAEAELASYCAQNDVLLCAWRPMELSDTVLQALEPLALKYGKTPRQVGLNWLVNRPNTVAISKTSSLSHLEENLAGLQWRMSDEDATWISESLPGRLSVSPIAPLDQ